MSRGGNIVDSHSIDYFPERWFDLVLVLRTNNTVLFDRLTKRGYSQKKVTENIVRLRMLLFFFVLVVGVWFGTGQEIEKRRSLCFDVSFSCCCGMCRIVFFFFFFPFFSIFFFLVFFFLRC